jgi:hypothetical protein
LSKQLCDKGENIVISLNREYKTVGGDQVKIYAIDGAGDYSVQGAYFRESTGEWIPETWTPDGKTIKGIEYDSRGERIPFRETDLIEVLPFITIKMGKQYKTRNNHIVRIYKIDAGGEYPVHGAYQYEKYENEWIFTVWTIHGKHNTGEKSPGHEMLDLVEID